MRAFLRSIGVVCVLLMTMSASGSVSALASPPDGAGTDRLASSLPSPAERTRLLSGAFVEVRDAAAFPAGCKSGFAALARTHGFELANPGQPYQATDVLGPGPRRPLRRLLFGGVSTDCCIIFYEVGGFAPYRSVVVMDISMSGAAMPVWGGSNGKNPSDLRALMSQIAAGDFTRLIGY